MDVETELRVEQDTLIKADRDIREGEERICRQGELLAELAAKGHDRREAERLLRLLQETLAGWKLHRTMIVERIAHLELRLRSV